VRKCSEQKDSVLLMMKMMTLMIITDRVVVAMITPSFNPGPTTLAIEIVVDDGYSIMTGNPRHPKTEALDGLCISLLCMC